MILSVLQENLSKALSRASRTLSAKPQLPILSSFLLRAEKGGLAVVATNMETTEEIAIGAKSEKEGGICVPGRTLTELVASLPADTVRLEEKSGSLLVSCGRTRATLPGLPAQEFPPARPATPGAHARIQKSVFVEAMRLVLFAAAADDSRPILAGVLLQKRADGALLAATDGYRLSVATLDAPLPVDAPLVVPARALSEVLRVAAEEKEVEKIETSKTDDGQLVFLVGDTRITTRLIAGDFPVFEKIIPKTHTTRAVLDHEALLRAVKTAAIFARDNANIVRFHLNSSGMVVSANTPQVGEDTVELDCAVEGEEADIAFNCRFLLEFLSNFSEAEIVFEMTGSLNPGVFRPMADTGFLHVIMPVRVAV